LCQTSDIQHQITHHFDFYQYFIKKVVYGVINNPIKKVTFTL